MKIQTGFQMSVKQELLEKAFESEKHKIMLEGEVNEDIKEILIEYLTQKVKQDLEHCNDFKETLENIIRFDCNQLSYFNVWGQLKNIYKPTDKTTKFFEDVVKDIYNLKMGVKNSD